MTVTESRIDLGREQLLWMYERMGLIREFEERLKLLVERGLPVGATHYYVGEEAVAVGVRAQPLARRTGSRPRFAATATASPKALTLSR